MIWRKALRESLWKVLAAVALLVVNLYLSVLFYPDFKKNFEAIAGFLFAQIPVVQELLKMTDAGGFTGYVLIQHFFKAVNVLGSVAVIFLGMGVVAKEVENRTIEVLLSRPVSRAKILLVHFATVSLLLIAGVLAASLFVIPLSGTVGEEPPPVRFLLLGSAYASLFLIFLHSGVMMLSVMFSEQHKVAFGFAGFLLVMFLVYFIQDLHFYSLFQWNDLGLYLKMNRTGMLPFPETVYLLGGTGLSLGLAVRHFKRRDF